MEHHVTDDGSRVLPTFRPLVVKTIVTHTVTYFVFGVLALFVFDYARLFAETDLRFLMRPITDPLVMAGPLLQPIRGLLFGSSATGSTTRRSAGWLVSGRRLRGRVPF